MRTNFFLSLLLIILLACSDTTDDSVKETQTVAINDKSNTDINSIMDHSSHDMASMVVQREEKDSRALSNLMDTELEARFELQAADGSIVTESDFDGQYLLIGFGFTHCAHVCPTLLSSWAQAVKKLSKEKQGKLQGIFISLDPQRDTPAITDSYSKNFDPRFVGLSGNTEQIETITKNLRISYVRVPLGGDSYKIDHTSISYLVSPAGKAIELFGFGIASTEIAEKISALIP